MKQQTETPLYATLLYEVMQKLEITIPEYFYLDMIYHLSHDGWCNKSLEHIAKDMRMSKMGVVKLRDRLIDRKLIEKNRRGYVKSSVMYNSVIRTDKKPYNSVSNRITQLYSAVSLSDTKNNNENNIDNREIKKSEKLGSGYQKAKKVRQQLVAKFDITR